METIVAIAILTMSVSGIMNLVYQGSVADQIQTDRVTATYLAADAIEYIRSSRDSFWLDDPGSNTFGHWDGWLGSGSGGLSQCQIMPCQIDTRVNNTSVDGCSGECDPLDYNDSSKLYGYGNGAESKFTRSVSIDTEDNNGDGYDDEAIITVTVSWQRTGGETSEVVLEESIFDYRDSNNN